MACADFFYMGTVNNSNKVLLCSVKIIGVYIYVCDLCKGSLNRMCVYSVDLCVVLPHSTTQTKK